MNERIVTADDIIWRFIDSSGRPTVIKSGNETSLALTDVQPNESGIYECYHDGNAESGMHGIMSLFVRGKKEEDGMQIISFYE